MHDLTVKSHTSDSLQLDGCKLSVLLTFHINITQLWRLGNFTFGEASIDYTILGAYWSCGENVGFWIQILTVQTPAPVCRVLEQDTLFALLQVTQL